jgi:hypothetical protein
MGKQIFTKIQCPYLKGQIVQEDLLLFFDCFAVTTLLRIVYNYLPVDMD